jgi:hypothetical protein
MIGGDITEFVIGELIGNIIKDFVAVFFPGVGSTLYGIYDFFSTVFDFVGLVNRIIDYIKFSNSLAGVLLGIVQLSILAVIPVLIIVILFNVVIRLIRRFVKG